MPGTRPCTRPRRLNERPDEEGITTQALGGSWSVIVGLNERPDEEGITTQGVESGVVPLESERTP